MDRLVIVEFGLLSGIRARAYGGERRVGHEKGAWWWGGSGDVEGGGTFDTVRGGWGWRVWGCVGGGGVDIWTHV